MARTARMLNSIPKRSDKHQWKDCRIDSPARCETCCYGGGRRCGYAGASTSNGGTSVLRHSAQAVDEADMFDTVWAAFLMLLATHDFIESSASQSHFAFSHAVITILNLASPAVWALCAHVPREYALPHWFNVKTMFVHEAQQSRDGVLNSLHASRLLP